MKCLVEINQTSLPLPWLGGEEPNVFAKRVLSRTKHFFFRAFKGELVFSRNFVVTNWLNPVYKITIFHLVKTLAVLNRVQFHELKIFGQVEKQMFSLARLQWAMDGRVYVTEADLHIWLGGRGHRQTVGAFYSVAASFDYLSDLIILWCPMGKNRSCLYKQCFGVTFPISADY